MTTEATAVEEPGYIKLLREVAENEPIPFHEWERYGTRDLRYIVKFMGWVSHYDGWHPTDTGRAELAAWDALAALRATPAP